MIKSRSCPSCLRRVDVSQFSLGSRVRCPYCRTEFQIQPQQHGEAPVPQTKNRFEHQKPRVQVEGYEKLKEVGQGAMGQVYQAYQSKLRRKVALKVLAQEHADKKGFIERFRREAATGARITHRNVVRVYDILTGTSYDGEGVGTEVHVIAMEFVDGPHLRRLNETEDPPLRENTDKALAYFRQICAGVSAAHEQGVVHRDLKPENIMLDRESGILKVADFGLAYFVERDASDAVWDTRTRMTMGTVAYMPPEQGKDAKRVVESGDVYSLGRILYELLVGSLPDGVFTPASKLCSKLPSSIDEVIARCLQTKPEDRYVNASDLLEAFDRCVAEMKSPAAAVVDSGEATALEVEEPLKAEEPPKIAPVLRPPPQAFPVSARYPIWALVGVPLILGLLVGAWIFGSSEPEVEPGAVWLLDGASQRSISPHTVLEGFPEAKGGLWRRSERYLDHPGAAGTATVAQTQPALAFGEDLGIGAIEIERRVEWETEGDNALRQTQLGGAERWVAVGFVHDEQLSWVGIDGKGDCHVHEKGETRPCGISRPVVTPARFNLRQVNNKILIEIDKKDRLPESLEAPLGSARLLLLCQNQFCRFDPKRR
jgi:serine/threonine protein kinase